MAELAILLVVLVVVAVVVARPLLHARAPVDDDEIASLRLRHRIAIEALRDVETDRHAGSLDDEAYRRQREEAEEHAAATLRQLEAASRVPGSRPLRAAASRRMGTLIGLTVVAGLLAGWIAPEPVTLASRTEVNEPLAAQLAAEEERQERIGELRARLIANPQDRDALAGLADAHLEGRELEDLAAGARLLIALIALEPENAEAHRKLATAYLRAGDHEQAAQVTDALEAIEPDAPDVAFLRGLIALRVGEAADAMAHFDRFLEMAPDDERVPMVRQLRDEAAGG